MRNSSPTSSHVNLAGTVDQKKEKRAVEEMARAGGYRTVEDHSSNFPLARLESPWIQKIFGGPFYRSRTAREPDLPIVSIVFVQDHTGNVLTASGNPSELKGGPTDLYGIYEGLSRVEADGVAAGCKTVAGPSGIFSVWHPEWVRLRQSLGLSRHPAQIIITPHCHVDLEAERFSRPDLPIYLVTTDQGWKTVSPSVIQRPWLIQIEAGDPLDWRKILRALKERGLKVISLVGGPTTATEAVDQGVVTDLYLTTSAVETGLPHTPWYRGKRSPPKDLVLRKAGQGIEEGIVFEHFLF